MLLLFFTYSPFCLISSARFPPLQYYCCSCSCNSINFIRTVKLHEDREALIEVYLDTGYFTLTLCFYILDDNDNDLFVQMNYICIDVLFFSHLCSLYLYASLHGVIKINELF